MDIPERKDLQGANLQGVDLMETNLQGANLQGALNVSLYQFL
jgi:uncharacterized protein YjbI with pentapeptide repeats